MSRALAVLPALLLVSFACALGGFDTAAHATRSAIGAALVLGAALLAAGELGDPFRVGRAGWIWPALVVAATAASWTASEIARAGTTALVLLPAYLLLPAAAARAWREAESRPLGLAAWSAAVATIGAWAIADALARGADRTALPLGHHNLLAVFLATALPVALVGVAERGWNRWLALAAGLAGGAALAATRSLATFGACALVMLAVAPRLGRWRHLALGLALLALGLAVPRLESISRGGDRSANARFAYAEAAWSGARERPWLGWGPGASPWTLQAFVAPRPGVNPAGELVGEPHSTPLRLGYELGGVGVGAVLLLGALFVRARWRERRTVPRSGETADSRLRLAGLSGAAIATLASLFGSWLTVPAVPVALALSLGAALAVSPPPARRSRVVGTVLLAAYCCAAIALTMPFWRAQRAAERAVVASAPAERERWLATAEKLDPHFPLYAARRAWEGTQPLPARVRAAVNAALAAKGVGPLWLKAGALALEADQPRVAVPALERAVALDPLSGTAPFLLFVATKGERVDCAARAILGEPKLLAATWFRGRERERRQAIALAARWRGIDSAWQKELLRAAGGPLPAESEEVDLVQRIDATPALSASLHLFRRRPVETELTRIRIDRARAARVRLATATELASSERSAFPATGCAAE